MANVIIDDTNLTNIANAIREKNGGSQTYKPSELAAAITALSIGGGVDFSNLNYTSISGASATTRYSTLPDLSSIVSDFSKIALMFWNDSVNTYLYVRGINGNKLFHSIYNSSYSKFNYYTPYDDSYSELQGNLDSLKVYSNGYGMSQSFQGTLYIYHE